MEAKEKKSIMFVENGEVYISFRVLDRVREVMELQQKFYRTRDKKTLEECKRREQGFFEWYEKVKSAAGR